MSEVAMSPTETSSSDDNHNKVVAVHWFRQDLRLHDNPALCAALEDCDDFYPVFIFDGKVASKFTLFCYIFYDILVIMKINNICWNY